MRAETVFSASGNKRCCPGASEVLRASDATLRTVLSAAIRGDYTNTEQRLLETWLAQNNIPNHLVTQAATMFSRMLYTKLVKVTVAGFKSDIDETGRMSVAGIGLLHG
jgi:hypothetical protein